MSERLTIAEQKNKRKGRNYSIAIHVLILLLLFFFGSFKDNPEESIDDQYAVAIDFTLDKSSNSTSGQEAAGARPEQAEEEERAEETPEQEDVPEEVEEVIEEEVEEEVEEEIEDEAIQEAPDAIIPDVIEVVEEESPVEAFEDEIVVDKPKKATVPKANTPSKTSGKPKANTPSKKPKANTGNGTSSSSNSTKPSSGKPGNGKTDAGTGSGKDDSGNDGNSGVGTGGQGTGAYDDSGMGIFGRRIIKIPNLSSVMGSKVTGKIVIKMCVNPRGNVVHTEINRKETTIKDKSLMRSALKVAKNYVYEKDIDAPAEQCGKFTFSLDIDNLMN